MNVAALIYTAIRAAEYSGTSPEWVKAHRERADHAVKEWLPSGSGFDSKPTVEAGENRLTITVPYHRMNEHGMYDGWENYIVTVTPEFSGLYVQVSGGRSDTRECIGDEYSDALTGVPDTTNFYAIKP